MYRQNLARKGQEEGGGEGWGRGGCGCLQGRPPDRRMRVCVCVHTYIACSRTAEHNRPAEARGEGGETGETVQTKQREIKWMEKGELVTLSPQHYNTLGVCVCEIKHLTLLWVEGEGVSQPYSSLELYTWCKHVCTHRQHACTHRQHACTHRQHACTHRQHACTHRQHACTHRQHACTYRQHTCTHRQHACTYRQHACTYRQHACTYRHEYTYTYLQTTRVYTQTTCMYIHTTCTYMQTTYKTQM